MEYTVKLEGLELFLYLKNRFKYTSSEAIESMVKNNHDISFLDKLPYIVQKSRQDLEPRL